MKDQPIVIAIDGTSASGKSTAARMAANPDTDIRPGLLVQLAFAAADFAFQQWVRQSTKKPRALDRYVTEALDAVRSPHWKRRRTS